MLDEFLDVFLPDGSGPQQPWRPALQQKGSSSNSCHTAAAWPADPVKTGRRAAYFAMDSRPTRLTGYHHPPTNSNSGLHRTCLRSCLANQTQIRCFGNSSCRRFLSKGSRRKTATTGLTIQWTCPRRRSRSTCWVQPSQQQRYRQHLEGTASLDQHSFRHRPKSLPHLGHANRPYLDQATAPTAPERKAQRDPPRSQRVLLWPRRPVRSLDRRPIEHLVASPPTGQVLLLPLFPQPCRTLLHHVRRNCCQWSACDRVWPLALRSDSCKPPEKNFRP